MKNAGNFPSTTAENEEALSNRITSLLSNGLKLGKKILTLHRLLTYDLRFSFNVEKATSICHEGNIGNCLPFRHGGAGYID